MLSTSLLRLWLRNIWASVPGTYATLSAALLAAGSEKLAGVDGGTVAATAANGHSVQFSDPTKSAGPEDWADGASQLLDLYDKSLAVLVSSGIASPTDAQIYTEMLDRLESVTVARVDFSELRMEGASR